jgi:hypothetical protein
MVFDLVFERPDGTHWPSNMADEPFPLALHGYACVRRGRDDCLSVGDFREQYGYNLEPRIHVDGSKYVASLNIPDLILLEDVVESNGWRVVALADPGGAVSDCVEGKNCIVHADVTGVATGSVAMTMIELAILFIYTIYFSWWIYTVTSRLGTKLKKWHVEDKVSVCLCHFVVSCHFFFMTALKSIGVHIFYIICLCVNQ